jgi:lipoate-protein ligase A
MKTIINDNTDPYYNLAFEEYLLKYFPLEENKLFYLWQNEPSIIVGRNQNVFEEINLRETTKAGIPIVRRISGGGTVYHDLGNLNFTFLAPYSKENLNNYRKFTEPIIKVLRELNIPASFYGKSDIRIGTKKISGNAQSFYLKRMLHHGTLLFDTNLENLNLFLTGNSKISSKSVRSNPSATANIKEYTANHFQISDLYQALMESIAFNDSLIQLRAEDIAAVNKLRREKYLTWEWNYGESPEFIKRSEEAEVVVKEGKIIELRLKGLPEKLNLLIRNALLGKRYFEAEIKKTLANMKIDEGMSERILASLFT